MDGIQPLAGAHSVHQWPLNIDSADLTSKIIISLLVHHFKHVLSLAVGVLPQHLVCLPDYAATKCLIPSSLHSHIFILSPPS